jgi:uncharacterized protein
VRIVIAGASGLIGQALCRSYLAQGHHVCALVRGPHSELPRLLPGLETASWNPAVGRLDSMPLQRSDLLINLAGAGIADARWTPQRKRLILESRLAATRTLCQVIDTMDYPPRLLVNASGLGYYGNLPPGQAVDESAAAGSGFLADVVAQWEAETAHVAAGGQRTVLLRLAPVLAREGGMLERLLPVFRAGLGARLGSGAQPFSWIALDELPPLIEHLVNERSCAGPFNACAPEAASNASFTRALARAVHRPAPFCLPAQLLRALLGGMADEMLLGGVQAVPLKLLESGYSFRHPSLDAALGAILA